MKKPVDVTKRAVPTRKAMETLAKSPRSINDYAKLSPISTTSAPVSPVVQLMGKPIWQ